MQAHSSILRGQRPLLVLLVFAFLSGMGLDVRAAPLVIYGFTGTVTQVGGDASLYPAGVAAGTPFAVQVAVNGSFPQTGGDSSLANYAETSPSGPFPIQSVSLELNGGAPIVLLGAPSAKLPLFSAVNHLTIGFNEMLGGDSFVDELVTVMEGVQANGNFGYFGVVALDQTFGAPSGFTTSVQLGAPFGTIPLNAINAFEGDMPLDFSLCANAACTEAGVISAALNGITVSAPVSAVGEPDNAWLFLCGAVFVGLSRYLTRRQIPVDLGSSH